MIAGDSLEHLLDLQHVQENLDWQPYDVDFRHNVDIVRLYEARDSSGDGPAAALLCYRPGARVARHIHTGYELVLVLHGVLEDDFGAYPPGTLRVYSPGSAHALRSHEGCVFLVVWERPVKVISEPASALSERRRNSPPQP